MVAYKHTVQVHFIKKIKAYMLYGYFSFKVFR